MRIMYKRDTSNNRSNVHFINLDQVKCFSVTEVDNATKLFAVTGDNVYALNEDKKIEDPILLIQKLLQTSERCCFDIDIFIDDCNRIVKQVPNLKKRLNL
jgi:hypothetical protein